MVSFLVIWLLDCLAMDVEIIAEFSLLFSQGCRTWLDGVLVGKKPSKRRSTLVCAG